MVALTMVEKITEGQLFPPAFSDCTHEQDPESLGWSARVGRQIFEPRRGKGASEIYKNSGNGANRSFFIRRYCLRPGSSGWDLRSKMVGSPALEDLAEFDPCN